MAILRDQNQIQAEAQLLTDICEYIYDPLGFVMYAYPWGLPGLLRNEDGPDRWQAEVLQEIGETLGSAKSSVRVAISTGHGTGKTCLSAWLTAWWQSTRPHNQQVVTANTKTQLATKTWREIAKWHNLLINKHWFQWQATKYSHVDYPETWAANAIPWSKERSEAFAGTHEDSGVFFLFDESSAIDDVIWEVSEGAMTGKEALWVVLGNPTRNTGRFHSCFNKDRGRWITKRVDASTAKKANKSEIKSWIDAYGEDSDFVRVRVRGIFPRASSTQFIPEDLVEAAMSRKYNPSVFDSSPKVIGVDPARFGDDQSVITVRQGLAIIDVKKFREIDTMQLAARVAETHNRHKPQNLFVDSVGIGAGVVDRLRQLGFQVIPVNFGEKAHNHKKYFNRRMECWDLMKQWLEAGGQIPRDDELRADLVGPEYGFDRHDRMQLEKKEDMKARGLASPDCFVAGTLIRTNKGEVPIESVRLGDKVLTPFGCSEVAAIHSSLANELTIAKFSNGRMLIGKGKHKLFSFSHRKIRLDAIALTTELEQYSHWRYALWRVASLWFTWVKSFGFKQVVDTFSLEEKINRKDFFIAGFGLILKVLYRKAFQFTTKMRIGATTILRILRFCQPLTILETTSSTSCQIQSISRRTLNGSKRQGSQRQSGMDQSRGGLGTAKMGRSLGLDVNQFNCNAKGVEKHTIHSSPPGASIAQTPASVETHIEDSLQMFASVRTAARNLWLIVTGRRPVVPECVQTENVPPTQTYNLTLRNHNAYYANDILVFNCADSIAVTFAMPLAVSAKHRNRPHGFANWFRRAS